MRNSGAMEYITPLHRATESSTMPKSVMNTTVGGAFGAACAQTEAAPLTASSNAAKAHTSHLRHRGQCITDSSGTLAKVRYCKRLCSPAKAIAAARFDLLTRP